IILRLVRSSLTAITTKMAAKYRLTRDEDKMGKKHICQLIVLLLLGSWSKSGIRAATLQNNNGGTSSSESNATEGRIFPKEIYTLVSLGNGRAGDRTMLDIRLYKSSDGTNVTTVHGHFKSISGARDEFHSRIDGATKIIERGPKKGFLGHDVGERCVIVLPPTKSSTEHTAVVWTNGMDYYEISSRSMRLIIDMEKRYYK